MTQEHFDMIIVGAGLSGIGAAVHLQQNCPGKTYAILEGRDAIGGTWDLFRYPGIRSDSDMYTLGYSFKPWNRPKVIADGPDIRAYIHETARENDVNRHIRFGHRVTRVDWDSSSALWTITADNRASGKEVTFTASFLLACTGYYRYSGGFTPEFQGRDDFKGQIIHPQLWPEDLDYAGKKVVVIGSGATAVTLVPAMTDKAGHVTMLQRSPSYVASVPQFDPFYTYMDKVIPKKWVYNIARMRNLGITMGIYKLSRSYPKFMRKALLKQVEMQVGKDFDMKHFTPTYNPWDERLCAVPNGDMFKVLKQGKASIVTDHIDRFVENGILLKSGEVLEADIIITATGLEVQLLGGTEVFVDGKAFELNKAVAYRAIMLSDLPNAAMIFGYTNASWTLKADISSEYICRLINHMDATGMRQVTPRIREPLEEVPFIDMQSGYIQRAKNVFPKQGAKAPWKLKQNYFFDLANLRYSKIEDGALEFSNPRPLRNANAGTPAEDTSTAVSTPKPKKPRAPRKAAAKKTASA